METYKYVGKGHEFGHAMYTNFVKALKPFAKNDVFIFVGDGFTHIHAYLNVVDYDKGVVVILCEKVLFASSWKIFISFTLIKLC